MSTRILWLALMTLSLSACAGQPVYRTSTAPLPTASSVDLDRYLGRWFEIHRLPNRFEDADCATVIAEYSRRDDGQIRVVNTCVKADEVDRATGVARVVDSKSNARLEVSFFRPFWGNYWIVELSEAYDAVLVGEPTGRYLWILGRSPQLSKELSARMIGRARDLGYPVDKFISPKNELSVPAAKRKADASWSTASAPCCPGPRRARAAMSAPAPSSSPWVGCVPPSAATAHRRLMAGRSPDSG